jgi:hypothetical protein
VPVAQRPCARWAWPRCATPTPGGEAGVGRGEDSRRFCRHFARSSSARRSTVRFLWSRHTDRLWRLRPRVVWLPAWESEVSQGSGRQGQCSPCSEAARWSCVRDDLRDPGRTCHQAPPRGTPSTAGLELASLPARLPFSAIVGGSRFRSDLRI